MPHRENKLMAALSPRWPCLSLDTDSVYFNGMEMRFSRPSFLTFKVWYCHQCINAAEKHSMSLVSVLSTCLLFRCGEYARALNAGGEFVIDFALWVMCIGRLRVQLPFDLWPFMVRILRADNFVCLFRLLMHKCEWYIYCVDKGPILGTCFPVVPRYHFPQNRSYRRFYTVAIYACEEIE